MQALIQTCTTKKEIRNKPVKPIINFFPKEDFKKLGDELLIILEDVISSGE